MSEPIRTLLKRVLQLHTMAGGPWIAEVTPESDYRDIPIIGPSGRYIARSPDDGVRAGFEIHDAQLIAEYRTAAPKLACALEAVLEVESEDLPTGHDGDEWYRAGWLDAFHNIRTAITEHLGGET